MAQHNAILPALAALALLAVSAPHGTAASPTKDPTAVLLVKRQYGKAAKALTAAAEAGNEKAQYQLASLYRLGLGVDPDRTKAIFWYQKAAAQGEARAARALKRMSVTAPATEKKSVLRGAVTGAAPSATPAARPPVRQPPAQDWVTLAAARDLAPTVAALLQEEPGKASSALSAAVESNRPATAAAAVAAGADSSIAVKGDDTALSLAVRPGRQQLLASLLTPAAIANLGSETVTGAFDEAARLCNVDAMQALEAATLNPETRKSSAAVDVVKACGNPEKLLALLDPALLTVPDSLGRNSLWHAARNGAENAVAWLLEAKIDPLSSDSSGFTSTHAAALASSPGSLALILRMAPQPGASKDGVTPLMLAAASGCTDCISQLLTAGEDVNAKDEAGNTALMYAVRAGQKESIHTLLKAGANDGSRNENGDTPAKLFARLRKN